MSKKSVFTRKDKNILSGKLSTGVKEKLTQAAKIATGCAVIAVTGILIHKAGKKEGYEEGFYSGLDHGAADVAWFEGETGETFADHCEYHFSGGYMHVNYSKEYCDLMNSSQWAMDTHKTADHTGSKMKKEEEA